MRRIRGEQYAQVDNADPFAFPVWRSPVHRTTEWIIWLVQLIRLVVRVVWFLIRHPLLDTAGGVLADDAPTQPEVVQILTQLHAANLLEANITPDAGVLLRRHKQMMKRRESTSPSGEVGSQR